MLKIGACYIARFTKANMPIRIEAVAAKGGWQARSLMHGRIVIVKNESQVLRECSESDLAAFAKMIVPNRRSKRQPLPPVPATESPHVAPVCKVKAVKKGGDYVKST
jgi:hypothetical protein